MRPGLRFVVAALGLFLLTAGVVAACLFAVWSGASPPEQAMLARLARGSVNLLIFAALLLLAGFAWAARLLFNAYAVAAAELGEALKIILTANPGHRAPLKGAPAIRQLARDINALAARCDELRCDVEARVQAASADLEAERNRLATLMSDLAQSVLVCNSEWRILLYNSSARQLFSQAPGVQPLPGGLVGLGRSIFGLIDRNLIAHTLETIARRQEQHEANPAARFVTTAPGGQLIRGHLAPVRSRGASDGFVLTLEDITRVAESGSQRDALLQALLERTRSSLANIRAAVETALDYPEMAEARRHQLLQIVREEAVGLGVQLDQTQARFADSFDALWLLEDMLGADLIAAVQRRVAGKLGLAARIEALADELWVKVDSFSIVQALTAVAGRLRDDLGVAELALSLRQATRFAQLELGWRGPPLDPAALQLWRQQPLTFDGEGSPLTLQEVLERHGAEIWSGADKDVGLAFIRLLLPATSPEPAWIGPVAELQASRPEFYDFDLFHQPGQRPELDEAPLAKLTYTVFDTETTGLDPSGGDEIVSIGAARIVNGRLLRHEVFDQLVDPRRPVAEEAIRIHGLTPRMLRGQPSIAEVLPLFVQFAEDTVLVAHNAAFDLRFFQLKEAQTGLALTQPVLDTLLLSQVVHAGQAEHSLEAIAGRLGVNMLDRHSALGDALATGEVFLRLIPLLAAQGIHTLREARQAAERTYYARLKY